MKKDKKNSASLVRSRWCCMRTFTKLLTTYGLLSLMGAMVNKS
jgi:hypothetical protein